MPKSIASRSTLVTTATGAELCIASSKGGAIVALPVFLGVLTWFCLLPIRGAIEGETSLWLVVALWFAAWIFAAHAWLWTIIGRERVILGEGRITVARALRGLTYFSRSYPLNECTGLRVVGRSPKPCGL